jgi:RNA-directed DNA polymerase
MTNTSGSLQDLRRRIYVKAKAEPTWRFWGLYVHVCKMETLREAYAMAKKNNGAPGIDGVTFANIEANDPEGFIQQISSVAFNPNRSDEWSNCSIQSCEDG